MEVVRFGAAIVPKCYRENGRIVTFTCAITLDVAQAADEYGTVGADDTLPVPLGETEETCASSSPTSSNLPIISKPAMSTGRANPRSTRARGGRGSSSTIFVATRQKMPRTKKQECSASARGFDVMPYCAGWRLRDFKKASTWSIVQPVAAAMMSVPLPSFNRRRIVFCCSACFTSF